MPDAFSSRATSSSFFLSGSDICSFAHTISASNDLATSNILFDYSTKDSIEEAKKERKKERKLFNQSISPFVKK
jgi:hypothetical protein